MNRTVTLAICLVMFGFIATAEAHFKLNAPASYSQQDPTYGDPQKSAPCAQADPGNPIVPTNAVTEVQSGAMLAISITETIYHPGHYRVSIAQDMASLPPDPPVIAGTTPCGSTMINANPSLPLLADGLLVHSAPFSPTTQTMQVPIPTGMTCTNCMLQVTQFMSNHQLNNPGGCFYHHCAAVNISPNAPPPPDGGVNPGTDAGTDPADPTGGCCSAGRDSAATGLLGSLVVGLLLRRRRRC
jgi:MYXO-CTERM domain-containing protein